MKNGTRFMIKLIRPKVGEASVRSPPTNRLWTLQS